MPEFQIVDLKPWKSQGKKRDASTAVETAFLHESRSLFHTGQLAWDRAISDGLNGCVNDGP